MKHHHYFFEASEAQKNAFLEGCRAMMQVIAHISSDDIKNALSRNDPDWIFCLCESENARSKEERIKINQTILQYYTVDKSELRGMILDRARINDEGLDIDTEGNVCERRPYAGVCYCDRNGVEITSEEFFRLSFREQSEYTKLTRIKLAESSSKQTRWINAFDKSLMEQLLLKILPNEPEPVLRLYLKALEDDDNEMIRVYSDIIKVALDLNGMLDTNEDEEEDEGEHEILHLSSTLPDYGDTDEDHSDEGYLEQMARNAERYD